MNLGVLNEGNFTRTVISSISYLLDGIITHCQLQAHDDMATGRRHDDDTSAISQDDASSAPLLERASS